MWKRVLFFCVAPILVIGTRSNAYADEDSNLQAAIRALQFAVKHLQAQVSGLQTSNRTLISQVDTLSKANGVLTSQVKALTTNVGSLQSNSVLGLDGKLKLSGTTALFTGVDVQITNGSGSTTGATPPGLGGGNLIIGYNEVDENALPICSDGNLGNLSPGNCVAPAIWGPSQHSGYHNLVIGYAHSYTSYGGIVAGAYNVINNASASVTAGAANIASGMYSSVTGGQGNMATNLGSSVSGGFYNDAEGQFGGISGGAYNYALGYASSVSGGEQNTAQGNGSSISGGIRNIASAYDSSVSGGSSVTNANVFGWSAGNLTAP
jgi:hypothetical protein